MRITERMSLDFVDNSPPGGTRAIVYYEPLFRQLRGSLKPMTSLTKQHATDIPDAYVVVRCGLYEAATEGVSVLLPLLLSATPICIPPPFGGPGLPEAARILSLAAAKTGHTS